jgi:hypothetical protein
VVVVRVGVIEAGVIMRVVGVLVLMLTGVMANVEFLVFTTVIGLRLVRIAPRRNVRVMMVVVVGLSFCFGFCFGHL